MTAGDKILIAGIILTIICVIISGFKSSPPVEVKTKTATISLNGIEETLSNLNETRTLWISETIKIEIKNGKIRVAKSNCPKKICIHRGWIRKQGEAICCVPNKLLIKIQSLGNIYDGITY